MGWNGVKVHCQGKAWELLKGDTFTSETEDADIMVDVQDARVLLTWPKHFENKLATPTDTDSTWDSETSPQRPAQTSRSGPPYTSPLRQQHRLQSPVSPSPAVQASHAAPSGYVVSNPPVAVPVKIYEDEPSDGEKYEAGGTQASTQISSQPFGNVLQELQSSPAHDFSDNDEENDPIIISFGPYGANLGARLESFTTLASPHRSPLNPLKEESISPQRGPPRGTASKRRRITSDRDVSASNQSEEVMDPIAHHVVNQLAYSRLSSTPLSTLMEKLPAEMVAAWSSKTSLNSNVASGPFTTQHLRSILESSPCVGNVEREGKDAAGKKLESEYYYKPELDTVIERKEMVEGLGGRGLRNCRKSHKVRNRIPPFIHKGNR